MNDTRIYKVLFQPELLEVLTAIKQVSLATMPPKIS